MRLSTLPKAIASLKRSVAKFRRDTRGNVQVMLALTAAPLFGVAGIAIDYNRTVDAMVQIQDLADRTVLFGASLDDTVEKQEEAAQLFLDQNTIPFSGVTYNADVSHGVDSVAVEITTLIEGTLFRAFYKTMGKDKTKSNTSPTIRARAKYARTPVQTYCLVALDNASAQAVHFQGTGSFEAQNCGVQSNSTHQTQSTYMNGGATATADFFNAVGGWSKSGNSGSFSENPEGGKAKFNDPFAALLSGVTCPSGGSTTNATASNGTSETAPTLFTGTTYNTLSIGSNRVAKLTQSIVYVFGNIDLKGTLLAPATTIVLCGANAKFTMGAQADLKLAAPTTGPTAGFAVIGNSAANQISTLRGGATTFIRGVWYTPGAGVDFSGNSQFNATTSNYFPLVVKTFKVSGTGGVKIGVDYAKPNPNSNAGGYSKPETLFQKGSTEVYLTKFEEASNN